MQHSPRLSSSSGAVTIANRPSTSTLPNVGRDLAASLAANIAHEIRNPLTTLGLWLDYCQRQDLHRQTVDLNQLVTETLETLQHTPVAQNRRLEFWPSRNPVTVTANLDKLKQVLINLVTNACEAVSEGDRVHIRVSSGGAITVVSRFTMAVAPEDASLPRTGRWVFCTPGSYEPSLTIQIL